MKGEHREAFQGRTDPKIWGSILAHLYSWLGRKWVNTNIDLLGLGSLGGGSLSLSWTACTIEAEEPFEQFSPRAGIPLRC